MWTHGHTHEDFDYMIGGCRVVCNPRGYSGYESRANRWTTKGFDIATDGTVTFDPTWVKD